MQMQKEEETLNKSVFTLTVEEIIQDAISFFERTLNGLDKDDQYRIEIVNHYNVAFSPYIAAKVPGLTLPEHLDSVLDGTFKTNMDAAKALAACAVGYAVHYADIELLTPPDEQGFMSTPMSYWHELKGDAFIYKNKHLTTSSSDV